MAVTVRFVGSGDFGSGGRFQTCILVDAPGIRFASTRDLVADRPRPSRASSTTARFDSLDDLHGDHCGVPFLLVDAMLGAMHLGR